MEHELFREDFMIDSLTKIFNLHWSDDDCSLVNFNGEPFSVDDYEYLEINPAIMLEMDEKMICDGILFFGDGTIEFHDADGQDAYCWEFFTEQSLQKIEDFLKKML